MKKSRKEFIIAAHKEACQTWKQKIEKEFPKLFKKETLEVGKWYKQCGEIAFKESECGGYGFNYLGRWIFDSSWGFDRKEFNWVLATEQEVKDALILEAEKRGFKKGVYVDKSCFKDINLPSVGCSKSIFIETDKFTYVSRENTLQISSNSIFHNGVWAEIIEITITRAEAEKQLNAKIID